MAPPPVATTRTTNGSGSGGPRSVDRAPLELPERRLAVLGEDRRDRPAVVVLDPLVEVDERRAVAMGQSLADDALAAARQPDEDDVHRRA